MKTKIKAVQDYFINKMLDNEMDVSDIREHTLKVLIDDKYVFMIWISNGRNYTRPYMSHGENFMDLTLTLKQMNKLYSVLKPRIKEFNETVLKRQKQKEFNRLKKELGL